MTFSGGRWGGGPRVPANQLSLRIAVLGGIALVLFAAIFFRLWYLQVLSGDRYLQAAEQNRARELVVQAPRGEITDRDGRSLVANRSSLALQVRTQELPERKPARLRVIGRAAELAGIEPKKARQEIREQSRDVPGAPVTLKRDVPFDLVYFLRENADRFPGISVERIYVRRYPQGALGAHLFGYVREVSAEQLDETRYEDLIPGDSLGQDGVELTYDRSLRGLNGVSRVKVDAAGLPTGGETVVRDPRPGNDLALTIDSKIQAAGETGMATYGAGLPGAFVAMDVDSGEILGMGSAPSFDPSVLARPSLSQADAEYIFGDPDAESSTAAPAFNRAIAGAYPTGSVFKPVTALAALDGGFLSPSETINDGGVVKLGDQEFRNAGDAVFGPLQLPTALKVSSDVFFYNLGIRAENDGNELIQKWAMDLGLGDTTGIDLPGEGTGLIPTEDWRNDLYKEGLTDRPWSVGDSVNLSVGQGDMQADPLQMAVAYAALGNGGTVVTPHLAMRAEDPAGRVVQEFEPEPAREVEIEPEHRSAVMEGLRAAAMEPDGTSYSVFGGFPVEVAGKTGTAERPPNGDQSWYVALAPYDDPEIVVAMTMEEGGFGVDTAAPAAREILQAYFDVKEGQIDQVASSEAGYE